MFKVNILGLEIILFFPKLSKASSSTLSAIVPNVFKIPIPLVPPVIELLVTVPAAAPKVIPPAVVEVLPF